MINSHELAHMLLSRRANTIRIEVLLDEDSTSNADYRKTKTVLRDSLDCIPYNVDSKDVVYYDLENDVIVIRAGVVVANLDNSDTV